MRWSLRQQIMTPMAAVTLLTVIAVGSAGAIFAIRTAKAQIAAQIAGVTRIVEQSNFPLTDAVLQQMKGLSGADLLYVDATGSVEATSENSSAFEPLVHRKASYVEALDAPGHRIWAGGKEYRHTTLDLAGRRGGRGAGTLHLFYPEQDYRRAWQRAIYPSLGFVALALPTVMLLAAATAATISRRMLLLRSQVERIAQGHFVQLTVPDRDDEIRALCQAVNRMAAMLAHYEDQVRHAERMRTLASLGGGVAHQLRNSATGCRMALDLHAESCPGGHTCESLQMAKSQLQLMEEYIQRFLRLGRATDDGLRGPVNLPQLIDDLLPLVRPTARHHGVEIRWTWPSTFDGLLVGDAAALSQMLVNLVLNALEAAAQNKDDSLHTPQVVIELTQPDAGRVLLTVSDSGQGPHEHVCNTMFEPFVSEKRDGVGLGLAVAHDVAENHGGRIAWQRTEGMTRFEVQLPVACRGAMCLAS